MTSPHFKPLLAASPWRVKDNLSVEQKMQILSGLRYPVFASPKFDGIRATTTEGVPDPGKSSIPVCRSLLPIPNNYIRGLLAELPPGYDGEILTYDPPTHFDGKIPEITIATKPKDFNGVQSDVMTEGGRPNFRFLIFDDFDFELRTNPFVDRQGYLAVANLPWYCIRLMSEVCWNAQELWDYCERCLATGYEGVCFRTPESPAWKITSNDGRSSMREQWLVKMKVFERAEAMIIGAYEEMANNNPITLGLKGNAERSSHKANMSGKGTLGGFRVRDLETGVEFNVGGGYDRTQRENFWKVWSIAPNQLMGRILQYVHQPHGAKEAPRIAIFTGFRDRRDMVI